MTTCHEALRGIANILAREASDLPRLQANLSIFDAEAQDLDDITRMRMVDRLGATLLGQTGSTTPGTEVYMVHGQRGPVFLVISTTVEMGSQDQREVQRLRAEVERLRAEVTRRDAQNNATVTP